MLKTVYERLRFHDGLLWTAGLTVEIKLYAFLNTFGVVWTASGASHDVNDHHQTKGLMSKTKWAVQMCSVNACSRPLENNTTQNGGERTMSRTTNFSYLMVFAFGIKCCMAGCIVIAY